MITVILTAMASVPWKEVITTAPKVMDSGLRLYESVRNRNRTRPTQGTDPEIDSLPELRREMRGIQDRLGALEGNEVEQAELISQMAKQEEALLRGMQTMSSRLIVLCWALAVMSAVAVAALLVALLK